MSDGSRPSDAAAEKRMKLRYAGRCRLCEAELPAQTTAVYEKSTKTVRCVECQDHSPSEQSTHVAIARSEEAPSQSRAGASARREYERRKEKDEARTRAKWGRLGGVAVALSDERQSTRAWERGAIGEERLGARLDALAPDIAVLHDRRIPGTRANIDHIAVTSAGVWVIDAKRYKGRPTLRIDGGIIRPRTERLFVGGRDCSKLVDGVERQVSLVREVVGEVQVTGALCFVEADWPLIGGAFSLRDLHVLWPKRLTKVLVEQEDGGVDVEAISELLATSFPPA
ncbi:hypothetical protein BJ980_000022 [Nocardioides daedukensis]|uniref:NERD domain-containing protein n=1 Tax=Nocardioides daedukensis TaxID=634462 RepID=A0A7Y9RZQ8_9ACTN|nr:nuclease-related domain-containing protein [Nocardioides daedukensis]NYG57099.1 hypothetical protein [Nocardioides daedukensis]